LYEVDEAATRIREEVDQDANIIVGATFDQALEGVVRVSVVATGIDQVANVLAATQTFMPQTTVQRISVTTERLRQEARAPAGESAPISAPVAAQPHHPAEPELSLAPVPEAVSASRFAEPLPEDVRPAPDVSEAFIPPPPERPVVRAPRMPRVEDLPLPGQNQLRAAKGMTRPVPQPVEAKRMTLLQRLAAVGLGRRDEAEDEAPMPAAAPPTQPAAPRQLTPPAPAASASGRRLPAPSPAPRATHGLDQHGRPLQQRTFEDDQLEIPAFLRRQSN
ncbi:MAG: cell division protein FtsZ, partial [Hyphomicrobiales bacterium]|nr:cell division protein FtsZ [Hyphomicrobiales bacterium]